MTRLARIYRGIMGCYSNRWRVIRNDPVERAYARKLLAKAIEMREKSKQL